MAPGLSCLKISKGATGSEKVNNANVVHAMSLWTYRLRLPAHFFRLFSVRQGKLGQTNRLFSYSPLTTCIVPLVEALAVGASVKSRERLYKV
jgi:hypothetical protein